MLIGSGREEGRRKGEKESGVGGGQGEEGKRERGVKGVQTCEVQISGGRRPTRPRRGKSTIELL